MLVTSKDANSLRSQLRIGSESHCLFGQFDRILWISDSEAGGKDEKSTGIAVGAVSGDQQVFFIGGSNRTQINPR